MELARPKTILDAIEVAKKAGPPNVREPHCKKRATKLWKAHQERIIETLEATLAEAKRRERENDI